MKEGRESNVRVTSEREEGKKRIEGEGQRESTSKQTDRQGGGMRKTRGWCLEEKR